MAAAADAQAMLKSRGIQICSSRTVAATKSPM